MTKILISNSFPASTEVLNQVDLVALDMQTFKDMLARSEDGLANEKAALLLNLSHGLDEAYMLEEFAIPNTLRIVIRCPDGALDEETRNEVCDAVAAAIPVQVWICSQPRAFIDNGHLASDLIERLSATMAYPPVPCPVVNIAEHESVLHDRMEFILEKISGFSGAYLITIGNGEKTVFRLEKFAEIFGDVVISDLETFNQVCAPRAEITVKLGTGKRIKVIQFNMKGALRAKPDPHGNLTRRIMEGELVQIEDVLPEKDGVQYAAVRGGGFICIKHPEMAPGHITIINGE